MQDINIHDLNIVNNNLYFNKKKGIVYPFFDFKKQKSEILKSKIYPKNTYKKIENYYNNLIDKSNTELVLECNKFNKAEKAKCCKRSYPQNDYLYTTCIKSNKNENNKIPLIFIFILLIINILLFLNVNF